MEIVPIFANFIYQTASHRPPGWKVVYVDWLLIYRGPQKGRRRAKKS